MKHLNTNCNENSEVKSFTSEGLYVDLKGSEKENVDTVLTHGQPRFVCCLSFAVILVSLGWRRDVCLYAVT